MAKGILFGADYYPEPWDRSLWESDVRRMQTLRLKAVRRTEFAWTLIEPQEG
jgi:beta-galactosidase